MLVELLQVYSFWYSGYQVNAPCGVESSLIPEYMNPNELALACCMVKNIPTANIVFFMTYLFQKELRRYLHWGNPSESRHVELNQIANLQLN